MRVLVVGGGGREHALAWKVAQEGDHTIFSAPANAGLAALGESFDIAADAVDALADCASANAIDFTIIGPEAPLIGGVVDEFIARGLRVFGPKRAASRIEGSKVFAKNLMRRHRIPTADFDVFDDPNDARRYIQKKGAPIVVKADGIAAGKGVIIANDVPTALEAVRSIMEERVFGDAGERVVVEEKLVGPELSMLFFTDGETVEPLCPARDHKAVGDGDIGPNTGGMGCYSPVPLVDQALIAEATERVVRPTLRALLSEGARYRGVLYTGLILTNTGLRVLEFNARFGDPETQVQMPRLATPLLEILEACAKGRLAEVPVRWHDNAAVCVVMCSGGYPGPYQQGKVISGLGEAAALSETTVFHAGTRVAGKSVVTSGGRVLGVTGIGPTLKAARSRAYKAVGVLGFDGAFCRRDIALSAAV